MAPDADVTIKNATAAAAVTGTANRDAWGVSGNDSDGSTSREVIGWVTPGADCSVQSGDQVFCEWEALTVAAGDRVTIIRWSSQRDAGDEATLAALRDADFGAAGIPALADSHTDRAFDECFDEYSDPAVPLVSANFLGEAGAVAPYATVTAENTTQALSTSGRAASDGSFSMGLPAATGDTVVVTATDGTSDSLTVP